MNNINTTEDLKKAIQSLKVEQAFSEALLKEQLYITYESLKPFNLLKSILKDAASSSPLIDNIISTLSGIASGYLTKKISAGESGNWFKKLIGSALQHGVSNLIAQHPDAIKSAFSFLLQQIFHKREVNSQKH